MLPDSRVQRRRVRQRGESARHRADSTNRTTTPWRPPRYALLLYRKETHPQELRQARERAAGAVPAGDAARVVPRVPAGRSRRATQRKNEGLQAAFTSIFPISSHSGNARLEFVELLAAAAGVRRRRMPAARPHVLLRAARQGAPHHHGQGSAEGHGQGSEGAGGLHGRDSAHDRQRLVHHQRHRARDRLAAAPLARRVLRARPRQDALLRQAAVLGARDSLPRLVARLRVRSRRTSCSSASTAAARCR